MSTPNPPQTQKPSVITSTDNHAESDRQNVDREEQRRLAEADRSYLLEDNLRLDGTPTPRSIGETALPRTLLVLAVVGVFALFGLALAFSFGLGGKNEKEVAVPLNPEQTPEAPDPSDNYKTQLALIDQQKNATADAIPREIETPTSPPTPKPATKPAQATAPSPRSNPPPRTRTVTRTVERQRPAPRSARTEPEIDPYALWNQLAGIGTMNGTVPLAESESSSAVEVAQKAEAAKEVAIASSRLGGENRDSMSSSNRTQGEMGILQQSAAPTSSPQQTHTIPIGTWAAGTVVVPIVWTGKDSSLSRSAVELSEPLMDSEGNESLPAGTILITEVVGISDRIVEQTAIAVLYERNGEMVQEPIESGVLTIRGRDNEPLIAQQVESGGGVNVLNAITRAVAGVGERLGEPEFASTIISGNSAVSSTERDGGASIVGGALEGFFGTVSDQLQQDSQIRRQRRSAQTSALMIEEGEDVEVWVNGFLEITQ